MKTDFKAMFKSSFKKEKILLYLLSLGIAIALWIAIISYVNPDTTVTIQDVPVQLNTSSQDAVSLSVVSGKVETVDVTVSVPRNQVTSISAENFLAEIDLTGETKAGTYTKEITVDSKSDFVKILSVSPATTSIVLDVTVSKSLPIVVDDGGYSAPEGYYLGTPTLSKDIVVVTGPKATIERIQKAVVKLDIPEDSIGIVDFKNCDIQFLDEKESIIDKETLSTDVESLTVSIPIIKTKIVPLKLEFSNVGELKKEFYKVTYSVDGNVVDNIDEIEVAVVDDIFDEIDSITLGTIDFSKINKREYSEEFAINMPTGVTNISGISNVTITIKFENISIDTITILPANISVVSAPLGKNFSIVSKSVRVTICGSSAAVKAAKKAVLTGKVSLAGASTGGIREYPLEVSFGDIENVWIYLPEGTSAPSVNIELK